MNVKKLKNVFLTIALAIACAIPVSPAYANVSDWAIIASGVNTTSESTNNPALSALVAIYGAGFNGGLTTYGYISQYNGLIDYLERRLVSETLDNLEVIEQSLSNVSSFTGETLNEVASINEELEVIETILSDGFDDVTGLLGAISSNVSSMRSALSTCANKLIQIYAKLETMTVTAVFDDSDIVLLLSYIYSIEEEELTYIGGFDGYISGIYDYIQSNNGLLINIEDEFYTYTGYNLGFLDFLVQLQKQTNTLLGLILTELQYQSMLMTVDTVDDIISEFDLLKDDIVSQLANKFPFGLVDIAINILGALASSFAVDTAPNMDISLNIPNIGEVGFTLDCEPFEIVHNVSYVLIPLVYIVYLAINVRNFIFVSGGNSA